MAIQLTVSTDMPDGSKSVLKLPPAQASMTVQFLGEDEDQNLLSCHIEIPPDTPRSHVVSMFGALFRYAFNNDMRREVAEAAFMATRPGAFTYGSESTRRPDGSWGPEGV